MDVGDFDVEAMEAQFSRTDGTDQVVTSWETEAEEQFVDALKRPHCETNEREQ